MEEVFDEDEEFGSSLSGSENEGDDDPEADEEVVDGQVPFLWSACNDRGSNVVKGMNSLSLRGRRRGEWRDRRSLRCEQLRLSPLQRRCRCTAGRTVRCDRVC